MTEVRALPPQQQPANPLIEAVGLTKRFRAAPTGLFARPGVTTAVDDLSLAVHHGESIAVVGESGSGKSTLLRLLLGLTRATAGAVTFEGRPVDPARSNLQWLRRRTGIVFQDPYASFNPRRTIGQSVAEPLEAARASDDRAERVRAILARMDLPEDAAERYPSAFSGGQRQRIAIARALVHRPALLLGDEPVSALDVLVRRKVLRLLASLQSELGITLITVTHDLAVVPEIARRVIVMRHGRIIEDGPTERVLGDPQHEYTRALVTAQPRLPAGTWGAR